MKFFNVLLFIFIFQLTYSQSDLEDSVEVDFITSKNKNPNEIGLNMTVIASSFIPFGNNFPKGGPFSLFYKRYGAKSGFVFNLGLNLIPDNTTIENTSAKFNIMSGYERRRKIGTKIRLTTGFNIGFLAGNIDSPGFSSDNLFYSIGLGPTIGVEYYITKQIYLSTNSQLLFSILSDDVGFLGMQYIPPSGIFLAMRY